MWILPKNLHTSAYVPDMEALSLDLNESSQLCAQSLFVRSKPSPLRTWLQKWKRDSWTQHLYGRILRPSHGLSFEIRWTFFLEVTPANHLAQQEKDLEEKTQDTSGRLSQTALTFYDQESASLKMSRGTLPKGSITFCPTWESWVTDRRGEYSARLNAARRTSAKECSSWPTASTRDHKGGYEGGRIRDGKVSMDTLDVAVQAYSTGGLLDPANHSTHGSRPESWATPRSCEHKGNGPNSKQQGLCNQVKAWATPQTRDNRSGGAERWDNPERSRNLNDQIAAVTTQNAKLNSRWVETLMGLPVGWTMPSCQSPVITALTNCAF